MTLFIAFMLLIQMDASGSWYFFAIVLWAFHFFFHSLAGK